ncbi:uncharacterized protein OCT59_012732 [Rhizophagus irregularis]|uniref:uncharacterized protein n=1 Tax=Rhizophagus irregularis TaxID=588596 RepID=UPI003327F40B|nr:hypothetical protein OCT59_012732 [Rhizophagus irregularis]
MERKELIQLEHGKLNYKGYGALFEWIPYNEFIGIKEVENGFKAIWKRGTLRCFSNKLLWKRNSCKEVSLKYLHNSQNVTDELLNEIKKYSGYGISQNPVTKDYIIVFSVFEWIPFNKFVDVKEIGNNCLTRATWGEGKLSYIGKEWIRSSSYEKVCLKYLYDSDEFINKIESYLTKECYGMSRDPVTKDYILVYSDYYFTNNCKKCGNEYTEYYYCEPCQINHAINNLTNRTSGNEIINNFIQEKQLKLNNIKGYKTLFEWIPYSKFIEIKEINEKVGFTEAIWKDGFLHYETRNDVWKRNSYEKVESYLITGCYGISQNPDTKVYILVFINEYSDLYCKKCGDRYNRELCDNCLTTAIWKNGPLRCDTKKKEWIRTSYVKVSLSYLQYSNDEEIIDKIEKEIGFCNNEFLNEIKYLIKESYGISQDPNTNDYILVSQDKYYCEKCGKKYDSELEINNKSCTSCQTSHENKKINDLIQEMRLINNDYNIKICGTILFEWISYDQFDDIREIGKRCYSTVYSAIWKDGLLYDKKINHQWKGIRKQEYKWERKPNAKVALKCLHNSKNFLDEFINKVKIYSNRSMENILKIYGISQNPNTNDYIMVFEYAEGGTFNNYLVKNHESFDWLKGLSALANIINGLNEIHQNHIVHRNFHIGNILFTKMDPGDKDYINYNYNHINDRYEACISDIGLFRKIGDTDKTNIYGVMPYVAPEVLKGKPYTRAADIYSFDPDNRPGSVEIKELIYLFYNLLNGSCRTAQEHHYEIRKQFEQTQEHRKENLLMIESKPIDYSYTSYLYI